MIALPRVKDYGWTLAAGPLALLWSRSPLSLAGLALGWWTTERGLEYRSWYVGGLTWAGAAAGLVLAPPQRHEEDG